MGNKIITLEEFFRLQGEMINEPRTILPFHKDIFLLASLWVMGKLPEGKRNLCISIPPGHGKTLISQSLVAWASGLFPDSWWIYVSYAATMAMTQTQAIKNTMVSEWYTELFPDSYVPPFKGQRGSFKIGESGMVYAVGTTGTITGFRAGRKRKGFSGGIIIDDPIKAQEGISPTIREKVKTWYTNTLFSRKSSKDTPTLLIMQRLHEDDLAGYLQSKEGHKWYFYNRPVSIYSPAGEMESTIWPETFSVEQARWLKNTDQHTFYAQYEQNPVPQNAGLFKAEYFRYWKENDKPQMETVIITADTAYKAKQNNDYSVFQTWGRANGKAYLLDQLRGKWETPELVTIADNLYARVKAEYLSSFGGMYMEDKASGIDIIQHLQRRNLVVVPVKRGPLEGKVVRANLALPVFAAGLVHLPEDASWLPDFEVEFLRFSAMMTHKHDDQVDAAVDAIKILIQESAFSPWAYGGKRLGFTRENYDGYITPSARGSNLWPMN